MAGNSCRNGYIYIYSMVKSSLKMRDENLDFLDITGDFNGQNLRFEMRPGDILGDFTER